MDTLVLKSIPIWDQSSFDVGAHGTNLVSYSREHGLGYR